MTQRKQKENLIQKSATSGCCLDRKFGAAAIAKLTKRVFGSEKTTPNYFPKTARGPSTFLSRLLGRPREAYPRHSNHLIVSGRDTRSQLQRLILIIIELHLYRVTNIALWSVHKQLMTSWKSYGVLHFYTSQTVL